MALRYASLGLGLISFLSLQSQSVSGNLAMENPDKLICSGQVGVGYLSSDTNTQGQVYNWEANKLKSYGGKCSCTSLQSGLEILTCAQDQWPKVDLMPHMMLAFCWSGGMCPRDGTDMFAKEDVQKAKICFKGEQVGMLYANGEALPNSAKSDEGGTACTCSNTWPSAFKCAEVQPKFEDAVNDPSQLVCVNPLSSCQTGF